MESTVANIQSLYDKLRTHIDLLNENIEPSKLRVILAHCYMLEVPSQPAVT